MTMLVITNAVLALVLVHALVWLLTHGVHADRRHRSVRAAEIRSLPVDRRDRIAA